MLFTTILSKNVVKSVVSARCIGWCSNYLKNSTQQSINRLHLSSTNKSLVASSNTYFQCRYKYDKSSKKKHDDEVGRLKTVCIHSYN